MHQEDGCRAGNWRCLNRKRPCPAGKDTKDRAFANPYRYVRFLPIPHAHDFFGDTVQRGFNNNFN